MYKLKNHNIIVKIPLFLLSIMFLVSTCFSGELNWNALKFLNKWVNTAEKNLEINGAKWKAVVKNLYSNSLEQADLLKMSPMLTSVKGTTNSLNDTYLCTLKDNDIINILYKSNDTFRKNLKNASSNFAKPSKNDMVNSCWILMGCVLSWRDSTKIVDTVSYCELIVNDYYVNQYRDNYNSSSLTKWNEWSDAFWNKSLKDSSYDILYDVYVLAKILFDSPQEPEETLFYEMPDVSTTVNNIDTYPEIYEYVVNAVKDRFSPYVEVETPENEWDWQWCENTQTDPEDDEWDGWIHVNWNFDSDFSTYSYTTEGRDWYEFLGDNCIDWFTIEWYSWNTYTVTVPNTGAGNWDDWWDDDNTWGDEGGDPWECQWGNTTPWWTNPSPSTDPDDMNDFFNDNPEFSWDEESISCFSSCNSIPCTATSCDRLACYAQCLCLSYESPSIEPTVISWFLVDNVVVPWLPSIFKIKFCLQPVQDGKPSKSKKVSNLETIIKEINTVIQNLRNSWELMLNKKTREYADASLQKNDFSKQLTFSIDGYSKSTKSTTSEKEAKENQIKINTSLMENILWFEKDPTVDGAWRDKYVVKWWKVDWWSISQSQIEVSMAYSYVDSSKLVSSLQSEHLTDMWFKVSEFLDANLNFWISVRESLISINNVAEALLNKKQ